LIKQAVRAIFLEYCTTTRIVEALTNSPSVAFAAPHKNQRNAYNRPLHDHHFFP
jgi:hypothetical protein